MIDKILSPFIGYWYWAQDRETPLARGIAMGAPLVVVGLVLYLLFIRDSGGSSLTASLTTTPQEGIEATATLPADATPALPVATVPTDGTAAPPIATAPDGATTPDPGSTPGPVATAFDQQRYTVVAGDTPGAIAEKLGVPANIRADWIAEMLALNDTSATTLQVGQELILPPF